MLSVEVVALAGDTGGLAAGALEFSVLAPGSRVVPDNADILKPPPGSPEYWYWSPLRC